jgi:hypothetical protein
MSRDHYPASLLARRSDLQKTQVSLLLRVGPCLQSCCLQRVDQIRYNNLYFPEWSRGLSENNIMRLKPEFLRKFPAWENWLPWLRPRLYLILVFLHTA